MLFREPFRQSVVRPPKKFNEAEREPTYQLPVRNSDAGAPLLVTVQNGLNSDPESNFKLNTAKLHDRGVTQKFFQFLFSHYFSL